MTRDEVIELLSFAQAIDRRNVGDAETAAWSVMLADTDATDAATVVRKHFQTSTEWLMPVHIVQGVRDLERARLDAFGDVGFDPALFTMDVPADELVALEIKSRNERAELVKRGLLVKHPSTRLETRLDGPMKAVGR